MSDKVIDFPQYRKLSNDKTFYCILSEKHFEEIMVIGNKAKLISIQAIQYPEILRIKDMLELNGFERSDELEFNTILERYGLK